ncbi:hypothetical protein D7B24_008912 [Verticillium nonalfalfae]|uniref:WLM domain-containing protein n=1 Tax=Verticillium nonalfalfae TaxID=1051616 RepID=A0A3M9Y5U2_9PEZI|nr:uncharacterized protein D7B24_008912 [Verticillium nonalfalfae]RNJ55136.1 hypothetical protein D7B24_008912 [Verticillium nonalfalfae]
MPEHDALVQAYSHLADLPRAGEALTTLKKVASLVKPIMRARRWRVGELAEFYPEQHNLLGLNVNRGQRILLRLRRPGDRAQFVSIEQVVDTMLHELSHIVHGPHDGKFHALWNQLRDEHMGLVMKGYTGEGFLSEGHRLGGGGQKPVHEARRLARAAAERRRARGAGTVAAAGQRLGGAAPRPGQDIRRTIAGAAERRNTTLQGCGNVSHDEREIQAISETATRNGFRTQAEEDAANEAAIAQALWELVQEEEKQKYGNYYVPPSAQHPEGSQGGAVVPNHGGPPPPPVPAPETRPPTSGSALQPLASSSRAPTDQSLTTQKGWTCGLCTLHNPATFLACDACGTQRGEDVSRTLWTPNEEKRRTTPLSLATASASTSTKSTSASIPTIDLTDSPPSKAKAKAKSVLPAATPANPSVKSRPQTWQCSFCGTRMEREWWTCWTCGLMKDNSR